ncbi:hypothetical protein ACIPJK_23685 [Streptomyces roseus]|uniref:hypothetical protein n=1 Tax=Streptomyces roseus TaxID=66430 RepID=UPI00381787FF
MFGSKTQQIRNLERLVRVRTAERDEARGDYKAAHADIRHLAGTIRRLEDKLARSERGRRNLRELLTRHRDSMSRGMATQARLDRALRACARYRRQAALDRTCFNELAARYWDALGYGPDTLAKLDPSYATEAAE